jgi:hypothetical protein
LIGATARAAEYDGKAGLSYANTTNLGPMAMARFITPSFSYDSYPRDTSAIQVGFGAVKYSWGAELGLAASPIDYHLGLFMDHIVQMHGLDFALNMVAYYYGMTINSVRDGAAITKLRQMVTNITATGRPLFLRTMPPVVEGSTFHIPDDGSDPTGAGYVAGITAINNETRALADSYGPGKICLIDLDTIFAIPGTVFRKPGQTWDGTHNGSVGAALEARMIAPIFAAKVPAGTNVIRDRWTSVANLMPNPEMGGYSGSRSGIVTYAGPGNTAPSLYSVGPNGTVASTATIGVEANPARGGFTATGRIVGTTLTLDSTTGTPVVGQMLGGPGISAGTAIVSGEGTIWTVNNSQTSGAQRTASIDGTALTISSGTGLAVGHIVSGPGVAPGTVLVSGSGTAWVVNISQTVTGATLTFSVPINVGAQRAVITVTPGGAATYERINVTTNPTSIANLALNGKWGRAGMEVELDSSPAWAIPQLGLADPTAGGKSSSVNVSDSTKGIVFGERTQGKFQIETLSVYFDPAATSGPRVTATLTFNPQLAGGAPFRAYIDFMHLGESADPHINYPAT